MLNFTIGVMDVLNLFFPATYFEGVFANYEIRQAR